MQGKHRLIVALAVCAIGAMALGSISYAASDGGDASASAKKKNKKAKRKKSKGVTIRQVIRIARREAKKFPGPRGPVGPQGPQGPQGNDGAAGAAGPAGPKGDKGDTGDQGLTGDDGATGATGPAGDDGATGPAGPTGPTGTFGSLPLPSGETLTGAWTMGKVSEGALPADGLAGMLVPISFQISVAGGLDDEHVHFLNSSEQEVVLNEATLELETVAPTDCPGNPQEPTAEPGHLCIYTGFLANADTASNLIGTPSQAAPPGPAGFGGGGVGASEDGAVLNFPRWFEGTPTGFLLKAGAMGWGAWAVRAP